MSITQTRTPASSNRSSSTGVHGRGHSTDKLTFRFGLRTPETSATSRTSNSASNRRG